MTLHRDFFCQTLITSVGTVFSVQMKHFVIKTVIFKLSFTCEVDVSICKRVLDRRVYLSGGVICKAAFQQQKLPEGLLEGPVNELLDFHNWDQGLK